jgi:hypothetical protein
MDMVVLWCEKCGALIGVRQPVHDWRSEPGVCPDCIAKLSAEIPKFVQDELEQASEADEDGED